jgi:hypothetical protein
MRSVYKNFSVTYAQNGLRRRQEDNIKLDLKCYKDVVWVHSVQVWIRVKAVVEK